MPTKAKKLFINHKPVTVKVRLADRFLITAEATNLMDETKFYITVTGVEPLQKVALAEYNKIRAKHGLWAAATLGYESTYQEVK